MFVPDMIYVEVTDMCVYVVIEVALRSVDGTEICACRDHIGGAHSRKTHPRCPLTEKQGAASLTSHTEGLCPQILAET